MDNDESLNIKILFAGDFAPCRGFKKIVLEKGNKVFGGGLELIGEADLAFINLECPLTNSNDPIPKDGPNLRAPPETVAALKNFNVVGLANNHVMDYGSKGLEDTLIAIQNAGMKSVGAGINLRDAREPRVFNIKGKRVALIAIAEREFNQAADSCAGAAPVNPVSNYRQIVEAREQADLVLVTIHGGNEYFPFPRPKFREFCQFLIDIGASAVVCHHPHVPGAYEWYRGSPIFYSIGNAIFDSSNPSIGWDEGYFVQINFDANQLSVNNICLIPYLQSVEHSGMRLLDTSATESFLQRIEQLRQTLGDEGQWRREWDCFLAKSSRSYLTKQYFPILFRGLFRVAGAIGLERFLIRRCDLPQKLNMIQCDAHRDALEDILVDRLRTRHR